MRPTHVLSGIVVEDIDRAVQWYSDLFGRPADTVAMPTCHEWKLGADVTLQVYENPDLAPGQGSLSLVVDDLDRAISGTRAEFGDVETVPGVVRTAVTDDPDGNRITLVETIGA
jgi:predicted enzyme related to lactoylglutathione lyase